MDKIAKRVAQAERQVARRVARMAVYKAAEARAELKPMVSKSFQELAANIKDARRAQVEDWELGPLAPVRDLGFNKHGASEQRLRFDWTNGSEPKSIVLEKRCAWAGGTKMLCLAPGDRVVILEGPDKGKIDRIDLIHKELGAVKLKTHHKVYTFLSLAETTMARAAHIPISAIRLVYPLPNPTTGEVKDRIINELKAVPPDMKSPNMSYVRWHHGYKYDRVVPGINVVIPWPETSVPEYKASQADTLREHVEDRTFFYQLTRPPMPEPVLDELRNKYSKFRTRHEAWYIEKKEQEAARKEARKNMSSIMRTPLEEYHEKQRKIREKQGEPKLTDEMLDKIGQVMAKNKPSLLKKAGGSCAESLVAAPSSKGGATPSAATTPLAVATPSTATRPLAATTSLAATAPSKATTTTTKPSKATTKPSTAATPSTTAATPSKTAATPSTTAATPSKTAATPSKTAATPSAPAERP